MAMAFPSAMQVTPAARPLRLAVVTSRLPLPMTRADQMTVAHWLAYLSARGHQVELFTLTGRAPPQPKAMQWLNRHCAKVHLFHRPRWRAAIGAALGWLRGRPLQVGYFSDRAQSQAIRKAAGRFDAVYVYYMRSAEVARDGLDAPTILALQVSQTLNIARMLESFRPGWERLLYQMEAPLVRRYETRIWQHYNRTVFVGSADLAAVQSACAADRLPAIDNALLIAHGSDLSMPAPAPADDGNTVMFLGMLATNTNVEGVLWFAADVWPLVRQSRPSARFVIAGRRPRRSIQALHGLNGIEVLGEVADPLPHLAQATVCISPVKAAAGMQNKLLDYFWSGRAVVATTVANEGIGAPPARAIHLADQPAPFACHILDLMENPAERRAMGNAARAFAENGWSWEAWFLKLEQAIETTVRYPRPIPLHAPSPASEGYGQPADMPDYAIAEAEMPWNAGQTAPASGKQA
jgi:polysaccharide biosynthesis protein PslH